MEASQSNNFDDDLLETTTRTMTTTTTTFPTQTQALAATTPMAANLMTVTQTTTLTTTTTKKKAGRPVRSGDGDEGNQNNNFNWKKTFVRNKKTLNMNGYSVLVMNETNNATTRHTRIAARLAKEFLDNKQKPAEEF